MNRLYLSIELGPLPSISAVVRPMHVSLHDPCGSCESFWPRCSDPDGMKYVLAFRGYRLPLTCPGADIRKFLKWQAVLPASRGWPVPSILARAMHWRMAGQEPLAMVEQFVLRAHRIVLRAHRRLPIPIYPPLVSWLPNSVLRLPRKSDGDGLSHVSIRCLERRAIW